MTVHELNADQLQQLRMAYNYEVNDSTALVYADEISDEEVISYYEGITFVPDDF